MPFTPRKYAKKAYKKVYGSRKYPAAIKKTGEVAKDIAGLTASVGMIMARLNVEKNYKDTDVATATLGQCTANTDGALLLDVTPSISQGDGEGNRHGNSLKLTGISLPMSFIGQSSTHSARKIIVSLLRVKTADNGVSATEAFQHYWDTNPLNGLRDANCPKNYRSGAHDGITCVREASYMLKPTQQDFSGSFNEQSHFSTKFNVKLQDVLRYDANTDALPTGIKYYLIFRCDAGNDSGSGSTLDVPVTNGNTGINVRVSQRSWYVDN